MNKHKMNPEDVEGYTFFRLLAKTDKQIDIITNATPDSDSLEIVPIEYNNQAIYLAAGKLGNHSITVSVPGYEKRVFDLVIQNLDIYLDSTGENPNSIKQFM